MRAVIVLLVVVLAGLAVVRHLEATRPHDLPWTPLDLTAPVGMATQMKLRALDGDPAKCRALIAAAGAAVTPVPDRRDGPDCGFTDVVALDRTALRHSPNPVRVTCPLAAALIVWERQGVKPAARRHFGTEARGLRNYGSYACRRLYGADTGPFSQHATANALDIAAVTLADGRTVSVLRDWPESGAKAAFLRDIHASACRIFGTTLGPDYNRAHADHLHLDMGGWRTCR
jgi:hypothetical protein